MDKHKRLYEHILLRRSDANVSFEALCGLLERLGFERRIRGGHHIFSKSDLEEILNLQPNNGKAKPYQVKQIREILLRYELRLGDADEQQI
ncbi:MAG: type II toxin-antitoxin system HicA family toxin [Planctomycetaceae bacterium]|nr:type II toxin-antitoxin system HicA family toxin [Planctomycetaceae bacterium]